MGYYQEPRISKAVFFWKCFSTPWRMPHSKSIANNTIQVPQKDVHASSSFANIIFLILLHFRENRLSNYFFNESFSVWSFWNVIFQIDSTILPSIVYFSGKLFAFIIPGKVKHFMTSKSLILVLSRQLPKWSHYLEWIFQTSQGLPLLGFSSVLFYWIQNSTEADSYIIFFFMFFSFYFKRCCGMTCWCNFNDKLYI